MNQSRIKILEKLRIAWAVFCEGGWKKLWWKCRQALWMKKYRTRGIDLEYVSCKDLGLSEGTYGHHSATPGPELEKVLKTLNIGPRDSIIDLGCGKGGALITMASFPFAKIAGLEICQEMAAVAEANLSKLGINRLKIYCANALDFHALDDFNYIYLYNPFLGEIFEQFIKNLQESLARRPRAITIIYRNPKCHEAGVANGLFKRINIMEYGPHPWFIYTNTDVAG
ncbi:MAG TPA: class I SAM-dependent methyltransferase [Thermoguttaceae bacterium]